MENKIDAQNKNMIPSLPKEIIDAIDDNSLLIFVGAGISRLYGYPSWYELGKYLVEECVNRKFMGYSEKEVLLKEGFTPLQIVTIAYNTLKKKLSEEEAIEIRSKKLRKPSVGNMEDNARKLALISRYLSKYQAPIITTNADLSLDGTNEFKDKIIVDDFSKWNKDKTFTRIFHLHGSIVCPKSMVFTSSEYASKYMYNDNFGKNLEELFKPQKVILFIGYSVSEFELIRYFLRTKDNENKHFLLKGYYSKDTIKYDFDKEYFSTMGINLLKYSLEEKEYDALFDVLKAWDKTIDEDTLASLHPIHNIKEAITNAPSDNSILFIKDILK